MRKTPSVLNENVQSTYCSGEFIEEGLVLFATNVQSNVSKTPDLGPQMAEKFR
jgi:hypothetical protein